MAIDEAVQEKNPDRIIGKISGLTYCDSSCHEQSLFPGSNPRVDFHDVINATPEGGIILIGPEDSEYFGRVTFVNYATEHKILHPNRRSFPISWAKFVQFGKPQTLVMERPVAYSIPEEQ